ncbi:MAG TPA: hypothetical protein VJZ71_00815 [Phycisphaerae bacterium]|nr:hypothetical protein [Phycisphaerae bacterium]
MPGNPTLQTPRFRGALWFVVLGAATLAGAAVIPMTLEDFHLSGTQPGGVPIGNFFDSDNCSDCHGYFEPASEPWFAWKGSLMGNAGRDPLFYAQLATANQDVTNVGYYCLRCHVPMSFVTGHAYQADGSTLDDMDRDGVSCHFCHSMVDPIYKPGISPIQDQSILASLADVPGYYGNAMFVLDPNGVRRGPYADAFPPHPRIYSPFHTSGDFCGTCHDVGNVATIRLPDGTYQYNNIDEQTPDENPHSQFPLERTFTEWKLSAFANGGVDMGGRFGGTGATVVSTCQDCHMPRTTGKGCFFGPTRSDLAQHDFAGASAWVLEIIGIHYQNDGHVDQDALIAGRDKAVDMLERAASVETEQICGALRVRVINESGHKLPTGHIEGRRVWLNVKFYDAADALLHEYGHYDAAEAHLDEESTRIYEMKIGLSPQAAQLTGHPAGETTHMSLADIIVKDSRIPPRGFNNAAFNAGGAPVVATSYADGQYWDDAYFAVPSGAASAEVTVNYQTVTRHYIEALRDGNVTNQWGVILHNLWLQTDKGPPIPMTAAQPAIGSFVAGDLDCDDDADLEDVNLIVEVLLGLDSDPRRAVAADLNRDGQTNGNDLAWMITAILGV